MRNELDNVIHNMMSMTPLQRITMARMAKTRIERYAMKMGLDKEKAENFIIYYFRLFVAADAICDYRERDLFNRAFETNFSESVKISLSTSKYGTDLKFFIAKSRS